MSCYRIVFRQNELLSCYPTTQQLNIGEDGRIYNSEFSDLMFALVRAENDQQAIKMATELMKKQEVH